MKSVYLPAALSRHIIAYRTDEAPGTVIIDTPNTHLYYVLGGGKAISYGIGVVGTGSLGPASRPHSQVRVA